MLALTRTVRFTARHRLFHPDRTEAENRARYGAVAAWHAHDYACQVSVSGPADPDTGMVVDLALLDRILQEEVTGPFGGARLNDCPPFAGGRPLPTCEALAAHLYGRIAARLPAGLRLDRVRVAEDPTLHADCTGGT